MTHIITDTTSCIHPEIARKFDIPVIPQVIYFGNDSYLEGVDMDNKAFLQRLKGTTDLPKTAAPPPELFIEAFRKIVPLDEPVLCIHPSSEVSGTVRSAKVAADEFPDADIRVIDTHLVASPLGTLVELAAQWAAQGEEPDVIVSRIEMLIPRCRIYFLVATLEYLAKGGRIGGAQALLGSILQIKPILTFTQGRVDMFEKERTFKNALSRLKELVKSQYPSHADGYLTVMHGGVHEQGQDLAEDLSNSLGLSEIPVLDMPPAIVTHGGPGILGVGFFVDG